MPNQKTESSQIATAHHAVEMFPDAMDRIESVGSETEWNALDHGHVVLAATVLCALGALTTDEAMAPIRALAAMVDGHSGYRVPLIRADLRRVREGVGTFDAVGFAARISGSLVDMRADEAREELSAWLRSYPRPLTNISAYEAARQQAEAKICAESAAWLASLSRVAHDAAPWSIVGPALAVSR
jgi:hypothetical protein